jgi:hypothetical protein
VVFLAQGRTLPVKGHTQDLANLMAQCLCRMRRLHSNTYTRRQMRPRLRRYNKWLSIKVEARKGFRPPRRARSLLSKEAHMHLLDRQIMQAE